MRRFLAPRGFACLDGVSCSLITSGRVTPKVFSDTIIRVRCTRFFRPSSGKAQKTHLNCSHAQLGSIFRWAITKLNSYLEMNSLFCMILTRHGVDWFSITNLFN